MSVDRKRTIRTILRWASVAVAASTLPPIAGAEAPPSSVVFESGYTAEIIAVTSGGLHRGTVYRGLVEAALQADLATAFGAPADTVFRLSGLLPHGGDLSGQHLGDLQGASNIAAYNHPLLYELWLGATLAASHLEVRVGRLLADGDFATTGSGGVFLNSSFGWPAFISANTRNTGPAFNRSALGMFAGIELAKGVRLQAGLYDGDTFDDAGGDPARHPNGLHFELGHGQGMFAIAEISLATTSGPATAPRPGALKFGAWGHTADFADQYDPTRTHSGNHGAYFVAEHMLWREAGAGEPQGLTAFARTGFSPGDRSCFSQTADAGLSYTGLWPGRGADTCGLGVAWARISRDIRRAERATGASVISDYELVVEASYQIVVSERCIVVPDLQWICHPGGSRALNDALVLGLRTRLNF